MHVAVTFWPDFMAGDVWTSFYDKVKEVKDWSGQQSQRSCGSLLHRVDSGLPPTLLCQSGLAGSAELRVAYD